MDWGTRQVWRANWSARWRVRGLGWISAQALLLVFLGIFGSWGSGCRPERISEDPNDRLDFSSDTLLFDTVFTTIGSVTLPLKIYNRNDEAIHVESISLREGAHSQFRMNVDGIPGYRVEDLTLSSGDSLWIFVEVTVDPNTGLLPFVIEDAIEVKRGQVVQEVILNAWGQNAYFHGGLDPIETLPCPAVWSADKPHVIYGIVEVDKDCSLRILAGTQVHVHSGGGLLINQGTLDVEGVLGSEVVFQGDRLEPEYDDVPGQWGVELNFSYETEYGIDAVTVARGGIWLYGSKNSNIDYAIIKNGTIGIQVDTVGVSNGYALRLTNTRIFNMSAIGLYAQGGVIQGFNNLIYDCGQSAAAFTLGGVYRLDHCTFANYWSEGVREAPTVFFNDWYEDINGTTQIRPLDGSQFRNCIVWGNNAGLPDFDELAADLLSPPVGGVFFNSAVDADDGTFPPSLLINCSDGLQPPFASVLERDFHLVSNGTAWDGGSSNFPISRDLDGLPRAVGQPDKGCFERQQ